MSNQRTLARTGLRSLGLAGAASLIAFVAACSSGSGGGSPSTDPFAPASQTDDAGSVADGATTDPANADGATSTSPSDPSSGSSDAGAPSAPSPSDAGAAATDSATPPPAPPADAGSTVTPPPAPPADAGSTVTPPPAPKADAGSTVTPPPPPPPADAGTTVTPPPPAPTSSSTEYAPYFYVWGWDNSAYSFTNLVGMHTQTGLKAATLAFVLSNGGCSTTTDIQNHKADIAAFAAVGGHVKASFGGQSGSYLENACGSASAMATALTNFVDATGITDLDFDVEQSGAMNSTINTLRSTALKQVQASRGIKVAFTLPAMPTGMTAEAQAVVQSALAAGVTISHVNLMTMDYGAGYSTGKKMGDLAVSAVQATLAQLKGMIPGLTDAAGYQMIGATPMIGQNDVSTEVFGTADATILANFAKANHLGLVAFWAIQRDVPCSGGVDLALCSNAQSTKWAFNSVFMSL